MQLTTVRIEKPEDMNFILGQAHFIKTVEDLHEAIAQTVPQMKFGIAFCESSGPALVRWTGNDAGLVEIAKKNALALSCGHCFIVFMTGGFPVNILNTIKTVSEVCGIYCATANPVEVVVAETPFGAMGLSVCYDLRFPELFRQLVSEGAEIFSVPSAFTGPTGRAHWEVLLRARAIENLCFVIAAAQSGIHDSNRETYGDSLVVDYWGRVLARLPRGSGVVLATLDRERPAAARANFPALKHRVVG